MDSKKLPSMENPDWVKATIADIEERSKKALQMDFARNGKKAAPAGAVMTGMMFGSVVVDIHELAKDCAQLRKQVEAISDTINQTVELFGKALADMDAHRFQYRGYWRKGTEASRGDAYTENGSLWFCIRDTNDAPRNESPDWNVCARAGRDGKDLR